MKISEDIINALVDDLSLRVGGGTLAFYEGEAPDSPLSELPAFEEPLVTITLRMPAFEPAIGGRAHILPVDPSVIRRNGQVGFARLFTSSGKAVTDYTVAESGSPEALDADILVNRLDLPRDGMFQITAWSLKLPLAG